MKYTAITKKGNQIISVFAETKEEAERSITMQLRGRPGRLDFYKRWLDDGKLMILKG